MLSRRIHLCSLACVLLATTLLSNLVSAATNPVAHYRLDETTGTVATDSSGNGNNGVYVNGPTLGVVGVHSTAADFDGTNDYVSVEIDVNETDYSAAFWFKTTSPDAGLFQASNSATSPSSYDRVLSLSSGNIRVRTWSNEILTSTGLNLADGRWHHVVHVLGVSVGGQRVYVDGELILQGTKDTSNFNHQTHLFFGRVTSIFDAASPYLNGQLDDVRVYNRVISDQEIAELYGLIGHYKLDETSGTVAADSSGLSNDGTYTGSPMLGVEGAYPGDVETAADFDGTNDHVNLGNLDVSGSGLTIAAWINADNYSGSASRILAKANGAGLSNNYWSLTTYSSGGNNYLGILLKTDSGGTRFLPSGNSPLKAGKWHHVAAVYNGSTLKLYKNGVEIYSTSVSGNVTSGPTVPVWIGGSPSNEKYFDGRIDDARVYNRSLSAEKIAELYGLVGHWKMDEGVGTTAADSTPFANDTTANGATWTTECTGENALAFDGAADTATTNANFDPPATGTVAFWMQAAGTPAVRQRIFGLNGNWEARIETNGIISFDLGASPYYGNEPFAAKAIVDDGRWYHIVASFNDVDDSYVVYVNGELHASGTSPVNLVPQSPGILSFGTRTGSGENWEGSLRDFRVYNRWLANSEISTLSGLAGYWKLDETSGSVAVDSSSNGNDGTYTGGVLLNQPGQVDLAADFDGVDDFVVVADDASLTMDTAVSMTAWIEPGASGNRQMIVNKEGEYEMAIWADGTLRWAFANTDPGWAWHNTGHVVPFGKWSHVAVVYNQGMVTSYVNGVPVDVYAGSGTIGDYHDPEDTLRIGARERTHPYKHFEGRIDDVHVFSRGMCPEEVFGQYKGGRPAGIRILKWVEVR